MEKSIEHGLDYYIGTMPGTEKKDTKEYSPLALAYIGDCVFDLVIKTRVAARGSRQVHKLHEETSHYVQASSQSFMMRAMQEHLTPEEHAVYRRGRNVKSVSAAKNQSITDYRRATGFEALIGFLYLEHRYERLTQLISIGLASMEEDGENGESKKGAQEKPAEKGVEDAGKK
ncbi:MAG TPA: ribonuclease III [Candidatus Mediterraneibacter avicola]|nr:ribonuclease III [Candidatus Mediterraneibacter avicola]